MSTRTRTTSNVPQTSSPIRRAINGYRAQTQGVGLGNALLLHGTTAMTGICGAGGVAAVAAGEPVVSVALVGSALINGQCARLAWSSIDRQFGPQSRRFTVTER